MEATENVSYPIQSFLELIYSVPDDTLLTSRGEGTYRVTGLHLASNTVKLYYETPLGPSKKCVIGTAVRSIACRAVLTAV